MHIYIYIYIFVYIYTYIYICMDVCICTHTRFSQCTFNETNFIKEGDVHHHQVTYKSESTFSEIYFINDLLLSRDLYCVGDGGGPAPRLRLYLHESWPCSTEKLKVQVIIFCFNPTRKIPCVCVCVFGDFNAIINLFLHQNNLLSCRFSIRF